MGTVRRDFLKYAGGLSAGIVFTPVPWKVLDDLSIWTQNWSWIPRPLRGEITAKFTNCTLCPAGCGVRVKCIAGQPYQLAGIAEHPVGRPALCPAGLAAHQLPYAAARVTQPIVDGKAATLDEALAAADAKVRTADSVLILDGRPGRCASGMYRRIAAASPKWKVAVAPGCRGSLAGYATLTGSSAGVDYERVRTVLSFGAPVLHGWSTPGRLLARRSEFRLIQVEPSQSRTAAFADEWLPVRPGSEDAVALAIASILVSERLVPAPKAADWETYQSLLARMPVERAAGLAGVTAERLAGVAKRFSAEPAVALGESTAVAGLNVLLGDRAAIVPRGQAEIAELTAIPDGSVNVLIADVSSALPPAMLRRKLAPQGILISLTAWASDLTDIASVVIPVPAWLEAQEDVPGPVDAPSASFSLAVALIPSRPGTMAPADVVARLSGSGETLDEAIAARVAAIHQSGRGSLFRYSDGSSARPAELKEEAFAAALAEGACWVDEPQSSTAPAAHLLGGLTPEEFLARAASVPNGETLLEVSAGMAPVPMLAKLYQESDLYARGDVARINPATARGCADGAAVVLQTRCGTGKPVVRLDSTVAPGLVQIDALPPGDGKGTAMRLCDDLTFSKAELRRA